LDGSSLNVADTDENGASFGYPGASRGESAFPQLCFVALVENGTRVLFGTKLGRYALSTVIEFRVLPHFPCCYLVVSGLDEHIGGTPPRIEAFLVQARIAADPGQFDRQ